MDKAFLDRAHQPHPSELAVASNLCVWVRACPVVSHVDSSARQEHQLAKLGAIGKLDRKLGKLGAKLGKLVELGAKTR